MSLEEQAEAVQTKIRQIEGACNQIDHLCRLILTKHVLDGQTFEFSNEQKQNLITLYITIKTRLETLVTELP